MLHISDPYFKYVPIKSFILQDHMKAGAQIMYILKVSKERIL